MLTIIMPSLIKYKTPKDKGEEMVEFNLATGGEEPRSIFVIANSPVEQRQALLILLQKFRDVFA